MLVRYAPEEMTRLRSYSDMQRQLIATALLLIIHDRGAHPQSEGMNWTHCVSNVAEIYGWI